MHFCPLLCTEHLPSALLRPLQVTGIFWDWLDSHTTMFVKPPWFLQPSAKKFGLPLGIFMGRLFLPWITSRCLCSSPAVAAAAAAAKSLQSCQTLCDSIDGSPPPGGIPGILQARTLEWAATSSSNAWKWSRSGMSDSSQSHGLQPTRSSVHGIFQARVLECTSVHCLV